MNAMQRKHIITLSGKPGSGKSSTADRVAEMLGYTRYSTGDLVRTMLKKRKLTLAEFNTNAERDPQIDYDLDEELRKMREEKDVVIDSRLGFYWIPESFKVYLELDAEVAVARIYKDSNINALRGVTENNTDGMDAVIDQVNDRLNNERRRFKKLYNINPYASANFDLIIDTSRHSPQTVALTVFDQYQKWLKSQSWKQVISRVPLGYSFKNEY
jgi:cytidylate kinase